MSANVSLWDIEQSVLGLQEIIESTEATEEEKAVARGELERWVAAEVAKVDRVRGFLRHCAVMENAAEIEATAMEARAKRWHDRAVRLKQLCMAVMEARGVRRLEGHGGVLRVQANGGKQAVKITREDLIPDKYRIALISMSPGCWDQLRNHNSFVGKSFDLIEFRVDHIAIRKVLETKCQACRGTGGAVTTSTIGTFVKQDPCQECNGTGRGTVPGAELEPRGEHLRVE